MTSNPLTPHEIHTLREIIREQEQSARRGGRELAGPWLTIKRLLDEREDLKEDNLCLGIIAEKYLELTKNEPTVSLEEIEKRYGLT